MPPDSRRRPLIVVFAAGFAVQGVPGSDRVAAELEETIWPRDRGQTHRSVPVLEFLIFLPFLRVLGALPFKNWISSKERALQFPLSDFDLSSRRPRSVICFRVFGVFGG
jgi:hypothetical protein